MNAKVITRIVLLSFVTIAVGVWAMKEIGPVNDISSRKQGTAAVTRPDGITVIHFHGNNRCRTCIRIGDLARDTIDDEFGDVDNLGTIRWEQINYDEPAHAHYVMDYELVSSTVVVTLWKNGKEVKWKRLDGVWDHVSEEAAFRAYVSGGVHELLNL